MTNLLKRIRFYLEGNRVVVPKVLYIEVEYDDVGDAYVIMEFTGGNDIKYNIVMHEDDMKGFLEELRKEIPSLFS